MNKQKIFTVNCKELYNILDEIKDLLNFNFEFLDIRKISNEDLNESLFLALSKEKSKIEKVLSPNKIIYIENLPITLPKLIEIINIFSLRFNFQSQSEIKIKNYKIDLNNRKISNDKNELRLTEREIEIILFLNNKKTSQNVDSLQTEIWKQKKELETHTVETHIYRLRRKISEKFDDKNFIKSDQNGYFI